MSTYCGSAGCVLGWVDAHRTGALKPLVDGWPQPEAWKSFNKGLGLLPSVANDCGAEWSDDHRVFLFGDDAERRGSECDDAPFVASPGEEAALGRLYALGLTQRSAAFNRIYIVKQALIKQRDAILAQQPEAVLA